MTTQTTAYTERHWLTNAVHAVVRLAEFLFWLAITLGVLGVGAATIFGFFGRNHWALDAFSHFRLQYAILLSLPLALALMARRFVIAAIAAFFIGANLTILAPFYLPSSPIAAPQTTPVTLMMSNTFYYNQEPELLIAAIQDIDPQILVLQEINTHNRQTLAEIFDHFPYRLDQPDAEVLILSQIPIDAGRYTQPRSSSRQQPIAQMRWEGIPFTVMGLHTSTPLSSGAMSQRNRELSHAAHLIAEQSYPAVLTGDFNISSFSPNFVDFLDQGGLHNGRWGHGIWPSWPNFAPLMKIPIDHFTHTPDIRVHSFEAGPYVGSDHLPLVVLFSLPLHE